VSHEGADSGVTYYTAHVPHRRRGFAVLSNTRDGAWPAARLLREWLG
jgi:hypothetical protein